MAILSWHTSKNVRACQKDHQLTTMALFFVRHAVETEDEESRKAREGSTASRLSRRRKTIVAGVRSRQRQVVEEWEVQWRNVQCEDQLAEGTFGQVWSGWWNNLAVAIKLIKRTRPDGDIPEE